MEESYLMPNGRLQSTRFVFPASQFIDLRENQLIPVCSAFASCFSATCRQWFHFRVWRYTFPPFVSWFVWIKKQRRWRKRNHVFFYCMNDILGMLDIFVSFYPWGIQEGGDQILPKEGDICETLVVKIRRFECKNKISLMLPVLPVHYAGYGTYCGMHILHRLSTGVPFIWRQYLKFFFFRQMCCLYDRIFDAVALLLVLFYSVQTGCMNWACEVSEWKGFVYVNDALSNNA